jgi:S-adenosylmethionine hydrolase
VPPIITLLTDFGLADTYVGQMKGAMLSINPEAVIVDLTHEVQPHNITHGAFLLETALTAFAGTVIHVAVVDPGVGGVRRAIAIQNGTRLFVGPDNGILSAALPVAARPAGPEPARVALPTGIRAVELAEPAFRRSNVWSTFHGRDLFGPAAAHLSLGEPLEAFGPPVVDVLALPPFVARRLPDGRLLARVVSIDRFGNVITDARHEDLPHGRLVAECRGRQIPGLTATYESASGLAALIGSAGFLELAAPGGSAAALLGAVIGDPVEISPQEPTMC